MVELKRQSLEQLSFRLNNKLGLITLALCGFNQMLAAEKRKQRKWIACGNKAMEPLQCM